MRVLLKSELAVMREQIVEVDFAVHCSSHHGVKLRPLEVCSDNFIKFAVAENLNTGENIKHHYAIILYNSITRLFSFKQEVLRTSMAF